MQQSDSIKYFHKKGGGVTLVENPLPNGKRWAPEGRIWAFPIGEAYAWLDDFARNLRSVDVDIIVELDDDFPPAYAFSSTHLTSLTSREAWGRGDALMDILNGVLRLHYGLEFHGFSISRCVDLRTNTNVSVNRYDVAPLEPFPDDHEDFRYAPDSLLGRGLCETGKIMFLARHDAHVRFILRVLGQQGISYVSLYKALDTIIDYYKRKVVSVASKDRLAAIAGLGKKTVDDIKDFTFTANKAQASGLDSRHGYEEAVVCTNCRNLTPREADEVMRPIIRGFVRARMNKSFEELRERALHDPTSRAPSDGFA